MAIEILLSSTYPNFMKAFILLIYFLSLIAQASQTQIYHTKTDASHYETIIQTAKNRCFKSPRDEPPLIYQKRSWFLNLQTMSQLFVKEYNIPNRIHNRAYYDSQKNQFLLPYGKLALVEPKSNFIDESLNLIPLTENFISNVISHVELALKHSLADHIHFADMGHSHLLIPKDFYEKEISHVKTNRMDFLYKKILNHKGTKFLYHTAEQLKTFHKKNLHFKDASNKSPNYINDYLKHRYLTRNIVGDNDLNNTLEVVTVEDLSKEYNTVRSYGSYIWWSAGYYIHSNKKGCFPYKKGNETYYFDLSLRGALHFAQSLNE